MELDYFISGSRIGQQFVKDKWLDSSSIVTRSFVSSKRYELTGINSSDNFSLFFTLDKKNSTAGNFLSNKTTGINDGFIIGFDSNNTLFTKTFDDSNFAHSFNSVRLGTKNCLALVKNNRSLSLYKYNHYGTGISQKETVQFPVSSNINGSKFFFGSGNDVFTRTNLAGFSGIFDQMVVFNTALTQDQCSSVFSGFLPYSKSGTNTYSLTYSNSGYELPVPHQMDLLDVPDLIRILNEISANIPTGANYIGLVSGNASFELEFWQGHGYYALTNNFCYSTGNLNNLFITGSWVSSTDTDFYYTDSIQSTHNTSGERVISHFVTYRTTDSVVDDFFTYNVYQKYGSGITNSLIFSGNYITGFYMDGIVTNHGSGAVLLSNVSGDNYLNIGYEGIYDRTVGLFSVSGLNSGYRVYWGDSGLSPNFTLSGKYIDISGFNEDSSYPLIYDIGSGNVSLLHSTLSNYATGKIYPDTAIVFTGLNSWSDLFRVQKENFWETSSYHLAHGKSKVLPENVQSIYSNSRDYWV